MANMYGDGFQSMDLAGIFSVFRPPRCAQVPFYQCFYPYPVCDRVSDLIQTIALNGNLVSILLRQCYLCTIWEL